MRIIKSGKNKPPKEHRTDCRCGCSFLFTAADAKFVADSRDGDAYMVKCPECKEEHWVAAHLLE